MNKTLLYLVFCLLGLAVFGCAPQRLPVQSTPAARASPVVEQTATSAAFVRTVCAGGNLNIRSDANAKAAILGTLQDGESLTPVPAGNALSMRASADGGRWLEVHAKSLHGWVNSRYLCPTPTSEKP